MITIAENDQNIQNLQGLQPNGLARIKGLVQRFRVCWEVHPEQALVKVVDSKHALVNRELRKIGFSLELYGTSEPGTEHVSPGCSHSRRLQAGLKEIADWILPREKRACIYEVEIDIQSLIYSRQRADRPDVRLTIQILHGDHWDQPIDECEELCLKDMDQALRELGACEGAWNMQERS